MAMERLLALMSEKKASDLFLAAGSPVQIKINGVAVPINQQRLDPTSIEALLREVLTERQWATFEEENELNVGYGLRDVGSFRFSVFRQRGTAAAVVRYIPGDVPQFQTLNLPPVLSELVMEKRGLVLVVGATGSGKTTTLASLIEHRNQHRTGHILTLEDPIEFTFRHKRSVVNQRQIGTDAASLDIALKNALRQAPDCLLIGEIRDVETMSAAISYAQSGHLVLSTLHANNASHALTRIVSFYSPENRRVMLADLASTLRAVVSQRLVRLVAGGRLPAVEILLNTSLVSELIEQGRLSEIREAMEKSMAPGSQTFDRALVDLVRSKRVTKEDALAQSDSPTNLLWLLENSTDNPEAAPAAPTGLPDLMSTLTPGIAASGASAPPAAARPAPAKPSDGPSFSEFMLNI
jgi:twitching motility protein PilU